MKYTLGIIFIGFLTYSFVNLNSPKFDPIKIGKTAPMFNHEMLNIDGTKKTLEKLKKEQGLLVVFSCNTCPFVVGSDNFKGWENKYNALNSLSEKNKIGMVLINSNEAKREKDDSFEEMKKHAKEKGYTMPYLVDENSTVADAFGAKTTPHIFLFDKNLKLVYQGAIDNSWDSSREKDINHLENAINQLAKGEKIKETTTAPKGCSIKRKKAQTNG
jgi:peroxiredoxin